MKDRLTRTNSRKASHRLKRTCLGISLFAVAFSALALSLLLTKSIDLPFSAKAAYTLQAEDRIQSPQTLQQGTNQD